MHASMTENSWHCDDSNIVAPYIFNNSRSQIILILRLIHDQQLCRTTSQPHRSVLRNAKHVLDISALPRPFPKSLAVCGVAHEDVEIDQSETCHAILSSPTPTILEAERRRSQLRQHLLIYTVSWYAYRNILVVIGSSLYCPVSGVALSAFLFLRIVFDSCR